MCALEGVSAFPYAVSFLLFVKNPLLPLTPRGLTRQLVARLLVLFVRHAALIRPISESGKLRLAQDMVRGPPSLSFMTIPAHPPSCPAA